MSEREEMRMDAYYYGFDKTGEHAVDKVLSAVACAGKALHHTDEWSTYVVEGDYGHGEKLTPIEWIQNAAKEAAKETAQLRAELEQARVENEQLSKRLRDGIASGDRVCDNPVCDAVIIRRDSGRRECAHGHPLRWVAIDSQKDVLSRAEAAEAELEQARVRIAELECWANSYSDVRAHVNMCKELEQARAERDEAVARLGRADFMVDAAFERGRASTLIEQHGSISEVEAKPAPAPAAGAVGVERLRAMAEEWHKPADRRRFIDDKTRGGFELGRDECADELLALANEAAADGEG
jgi:hypothetical protein